MFSKGQLVRCIDDETMKNHLTKNKIYEILDFAPKAVFVREVDPKTHKNVKNEKIYAFDYRFQALYQKFNPFEIKL